MPPKLAWTSVLVGLLMPAVSYADDTEYHFGFTTGTNIGDLGEKEIESRLEGRFGKRAGSYSALSKKVEAEFVPWRDFRFSVGTSVAYHDIVGVPDLADRNRGAFNGISLGFRYRLLDREHAPFGLAIEAEPQWARVDGTSGAPVDQYGSQLSVLIDKEIVPNRIISVFNLVYEPEAARSRISGAWSRESTFRVATALMVQPQPNIFLGAEARYLRKYDGLASTHSKDTHCTLGQQCPRSLAATGCWLLGIYRLRGGQSKNRDGSTSRTLSGIRSGSSSVSLTDLAASQWTAGAHRPGVAAGSNALRAASTGRHVTVT